ncbi:response regulator transcription factor [Pedobacter frigidisoli]|uniref:Response regulator transcription factor n=1 Tax=Pedobacter frigidisoli TaxID=2530455 RepID=A0A4R0NW05_9SPHI|nr:LytTR family DNA-binding domain-containing protein [Pedobacter frigidisoli]TCD05862.1 response regulator transcription factor [Pedobacter frigidisoli]
MTELKCIVIDDEPYSITRIEELILVTPGVTHEQSFENAYDAMNYLHNHKHIDLILSDIGMPYINGIEAAQLLKPYCDFLVFITGHRNYGEESFEVGVDGYLMKPLKRIKFIQQIQKLLAIREQAHELTRDDKFILVKGSLKNNYVTIECDKITHVKALSNYIQVFSTAGVQTTYLSLTEMDSLLRNKTSFLRINRSEIISFNYVKNIDGLQILMSDGNKFSVSRTYKSSFEDFLKKRIP